MSEDPDRVPESVVPYRTTRSYSFPEPVQARIDEGDTPEERERRLQEAIDLKLYKGHIDFTRRIVTKEQKEAWRKQHGQR